MAAANFDEVAGYESQAREFLAKGREYLAADDLHQASEKGWGAAAHMAKAVATAQGWQYTRHGHFHRIMNQAQQLTGNDRLPYLHGRAEILHINYYELKDELESGRIGRDIEDVAELIEILYPLTGLNPGG
jgi:hypothetical protein